MPIRSTTNTPGVTPTASGAPAVNLGELVVTLDLEGVVRAASRITEG